MRIIKFKLLISAMILTLLITCIPLNGFAEEDSLSKDIQKIKTLFKIGEEYERFNKHQYEGINGKNITNLSWSGQNKNIGVDIDEEGNITGYWKSEYSPNRDTRIFKFPKITKEEGEKIAKDFLKKLYPDVLDKIKSRDEDDIYNAYRRNNLRDYSYSYTRVEDDIFFNENNVYISVDTQTGEVSNFNISWDNSLKFEEPKNIISKDEAKKIYKDNIDLELVYKVKETDEDTKSYLGYKIIDTDKTVDAKTKGILSTSYKPSYSIYGTVFNRIMGNISNEKEIELINSKKIVNGEEAGKKIIDTFELGKEYEISDYRLKGIEEKDIYIWEVMIMKRVGNHGSGTSSRIDAKTGEIIDFSDPGYMGEDEEKSKYSKEELLKKAKEIIKNMSLEKYKEVEYIENENEDLFYRDRNLSSFVFIRKVNGIEVENNGFRITLSNLTGDVMSYNCNWNDLEFEAPENIISKDKAKEILLEDIELDLGYQIENEENEENEEKNVKLVYDFNEKYLTVDAKKVEIVGDREEIIEQTIVEKYDDIESSFAKEQIEKLQNYIILFEGEKLKPKQEITQKEFFKLLVQTIDIFYSYEDENYMYERLIGEGILKNEEKNIEAKITREEAIKYIIRAFGQEPLEYLGNIYKLEYHDVDKISSDLKGHIAIAKGLGLISEGRNFRPKDNLTREEAAVLVYNILNRDR